MNPIIDFHTHILPGIDDGSASVSESIALLKQEADQGIRHVVATPHFYARHDTPRSFLSRRREAERKLRERMQKYEGLPQVSIGAEVYYFPGMQHSDVLQELTICSGKYILIEMPDSPWTDTMYRELEGIYNKQGLMPVVAHIDRYIRPFHRYQIPERLAQLPVLVQANACFFIQHKTRRMAVQMLKAGQIQLLGSDCHNLTSRQPDLAAAVDIIQKRCGYEAMQQIQFYQESILGDGIDIT